MPYSSLLNPFTAHLLNLDLTDRLEQYVACANVALMHYPIADVHPVFLQHNAGVTYRVDRSDGTPCYLLKIHEPIGTSQRAPLHQITARLQWLATVHCQSTFLVQAPVLNNAGHFLTWVTHPMLPTPFVCTLQTWVAGEPVRGDLTVQQIEHIGMMIATLHNIAHQIRDITYDCLPRLEPADVSQWLQGFQSVVASGLLTEADVDILAATTAKLHRVLIRTREQPDVWMPVHGDLNHANLLFDDEVVHPIDFDGLHLAPYWMDLGTMLYHIHYQGTSAHRALMKGYTIVRTIPDRDRAHIDAAVTLSAMSNLAFQITIAEQRASPILHRNIRQLIDEFCSALLDETPLITV